MMSATINCFKENDLAFNASVLGLSLKAFCDDDARYLVPAAALVVLCHAWTDEEEDCMEDEVPFMDAEEGDEWTQYKDSDEFVHEGMLHAVMDSSPLSPIEEEDEQPMDYDTHDNRRRLLTKANCLTMEAIPEEVPGVLRFHPQVVTEIYELDMSEEAVQYRRNDPSIEDGRTVRFDPQVVTEIYELDMSEDAVQYRKEGKRLYKAARAQEAWEAQLLTKANIDCLETIEEEVGQQFEAAFANEEGPIDMDIDEEYECLDVLPPAPPAPSKPIQAPQGPAIQVSKFVLPDDDEDHEEATTLIVPIATANNLDDDDFLLPEPFSMEPVYRFHLRFQVPYHHGAIVPYQPRTIVEYNSDRALMVAYNTRSVASRVLVEYNRVRTLVAYNTSSTAMVLYQARDIVAVEEEELATFDGNNNDPIDSNFDGGIDDDTDLIRNDPRPCRKEAKKKKKKPRVASRKQPARACKACKKQAAKEQRKSASRKQPARVCKKQQPAQRRKQPARQAKSANPFGS